MYTRTNTVRVIHVIPTRTSTFASKLTYCIILNKVYIKYLIIHYTIHNTE